MTLLPGMMFPIGGGFSLVPIGNSGRFDTGSELSLTYTLNAPWTFSGFLSRADVTSLNNILGTSAEINFTSGEALTAEALTTTELFRDPIGFYHVHVSDNGLVVNGENLGSVTTTNLTNAKLLDDFRGHASEIILKSGTHAYTNFGKESTPGYWTPRANAGVDAEHYLTFSNSGNLGENSGTGSDWTATSVTQSTNTPTNIEATLNPLKRTNGTYSNVNSYVLFAGVNNDSGVPTIAAPSGFGKWYAEFTVSAVGSGSQYGICDIDNSNLGYESAGDPYVFSDGYGYRSSDGFKKNNNSSSAYGNSFTTGDIIGIAWDAENGTIWFSKNGTWQNSATSAEITAGTTTNAAYSGIAAANKYIQFSQSSTGATTAHFAAEDWTYTAPTDFVSLNTTNITGAIAADTNVTGSFPGNANADGAYVYLGYTPDPDGTCTINSNTVTWGTHAYRTINGFKVITSSASYNASGSNTYDMDVIGPFIDDEGRVVASQFD